MGSSVDLLSLSFLGAFRRRSFTDDCANFMVKRSVWEEKERQTKISSWMWLNWRGNMYRTRVEEANSRIQGMVRSIYFSINKP